ncbi:biotin--[acetyl-CoA-carboxylase] ligase [Tenacibaculum jejuense]|uniref:Probable biotin -- [acetyl-CoA-carboxylase] ligase n=1 Tax=Tenacibaculum jejuense TaxID=584609 RepID=A0A238U805_9FLAO|nr:biotin--[acetyl-CoA-carboxylase] ligase [Tenacibaculum jejuense]SNR15165.1 Probable biotin -- [acetyl-CoA-carboxylase] ligase [Tenacibaculum jejuense]
MNIIKLDATESTNSFLKELSVNSQLSNFTVVVTDKQTSGRGQMNTKWISEPNKNLLSSIYITLSDYPIHKQVYLNFAIAIAIHEGLSHFELPDLEIKWPNDILSGKKKVCGILIENILKGNKIDASIVGFGININQQNFPPEIPNADSIKNITGKTVQVEDVLFEIVKKIEEKVFLLSTGKYDVLNDEYHKVLHKKNTPSMFKDDKGVVFMGKILKVDTSNGKLLIELADETIRSFHLKEVLFI